MVLVISIVVVTGNNGDKYSHINFEILNEIIVSSIYDNTDISDNNDISNNIDISDNNAYK